GSDIKTSARFGSGGGTRGSSPGGIAYCAGMGNDSGTRLQPARTRKPQASPAAPLVAIPVYAEKGSVMSRKTSRPALSVLFHLIAHRRFDGIAQTPNRLPIEQLAGFGNIGDAAVRVVISFAIELLARNVDDFRQRHLGVPELL